MSWVRASRVIFESARFLSASIPEPRKEPSSAAKLSFGAGNSGLFQNRSFNIYPDLRRDLGYRHLVRGFNACQATGQVRPLDAFGQLALCLAGAEDQDRF